MADLTFAQVDELLKADFETGKLFWRKRTPDMFSDGVHSAQHECKRWNSRYSGAEALTHLSSEGYRIGAVLGKSIKAHRVLWLLSSGEWPNEDIDHINGDRSDNRLVNLRVVSRSENSKNQRIRSDNRSGVTGVSLRIRDGKWIARIHVDGKEKLIGKFDDLHNAIEARKSAERAYGYHPNHGRS